MKLPIIGKLYFVKEINKFIIFRKVLCNINGVTLRFDLFEDETRKQKVFDATLTDKIEDELNSLTIIEVDSPAERKRRPFDYVDLDKAIMLIKPKQPVKIITATDYTYQRQEWDWTTRQWNNVDVSCNSFSGFLEKVDNETVKFIGKYFYGYKIELIIPIKDIVKLQFKSYTFKRS